MNSQSAPHGGQLIDLYLKGDALSQAKASAANYPAWTLNNRQLCDLELLLNGGFSPLRGYLNKPDHDSVLTQMRLGNGLLWPIPISLDVTAEFADKATLTREIALYDQEGLLIAIMQVEDSWAADLHNEAIHCFGTADASHPGVDRFINDHNPVHLGGSVQGITPPARYAFARYRHTPAQLRQEFNRRSWSKTLAFHTSSPMFGAQIALTSRAAREQQANLVIQAAVDGDYPGLVDDFTRMRSYEEAMRQFPEQTSMLEATPLAPRLAGPREALWHAIIRQNFGLSQIIIGKDHASPEGGDWYGSTEAQSLVQQYANELEIEIVLVEATVHVQERAEYLPLNEAPAGSTHNHLSMEELRRRLDRGLEIPDWFSPPEIIEEIRKARPPRYQQGFTVFFTGLSGSGKSTLANALMNKLREQGERSVSLLDGDIVRHNLSSELGFSKAHRDLNILRIGFVAGEITRAGGIAICAPIAPYR
ncbi:MAG TPA: adenylyl-sulfate kinase, partial [Gammaproteobacteria bacterium]|nr:adenylyl-sulfate kinase [Gammaproteobacteria bacterium]